MNTGISVEGHQEQISRSIWRRLLSNSGTLLGLGILAIIVLITLLGPLIVHNDPFAVQMTERLQPPSWQYPLGTDHLGRCIFSRLAAGAETSVGLSVLVIVVVMLLGTPAGLLSGYVGGRLDVLVMRLIDAIGVLPPYLLVIVISGFLGPGLINLILSIVLVSWIDYARIVRSIALSEREKDYVWAARVAGCGTWTILSRHLLPKIISPVLVVAALDIGKTILVISSLSYLGLGAQPPSPEWGTMLIDGSPYFQTAPELMIYPGIAIMLVVITCNLIGEGMRDILDVRGKG